MIDLHAHIIPGVDDGARTLKEAIKMVKLASKKGTRAILCTPHGYMEERLVDKREMMRQFLVLKEEVKKQNIPVSLAFGMEVFAQKEDFLERFEKGDFARLNQSDYMLVEFPFESSTDFIQWVIQVLIKRNIKPIIAHAERYSAFQKNPELAYVLNRKGVSIQINKGSLFGSFGKKAQYTANLLLTYNLVQLIASDCHNLENRSPALDQAYAYICEEYSKGYADVLMKINPARVWKNEEILIINPQNPKR